jgi:hypothetical protein
MARYFMQLRDGGNELLDPDGIEHSDLDALRKGVLVGVRSLLSEDVKAGVIDLRFRIDAEDHNGVVVYALSFAEALQIIPADVLPDGSDASSTTAENL